MATLDFLSVAGIATVSRLVRRGVGEALSAAESLGYPVAVKSANPTLIHKTDHGGVFLDLRSPADVEAACLQLEDRKLGNTFLVEKFLRGVECLVGFKASGDLGRSLVLGMGGTRVEVMGPPIVEMMPLRRNDLRQRLVRSPLGEMLRGYRGAESVSIDVLLDLVMRAAELFEGNPGIQELEMNPVVVGRDVAVPVDARMRVSSPPPQSAGDRRRTGDLSRLLNPSAIAVIGASNNLAKPGGRVLANLVSHGFSGRIYPVNRSGTEVQGMASYPSVADLPDEPIDLACVAVPPAQLTSVIEACDTRGIPCALIMTGSSDTELTQLVSRGSVKTRICGPNSLGLVSPSNRLYASFAGMLALAIEPRAAPASGVAFISQSGGIASALGSRLISESVNLTRWLSTGNEIDIDITETLDHLSEDPLVDTILLYVEGVRDGGAFVEAASRCRAQGKRVIVYKAGISDSGQQAIISHTGALAGDNLVYDAIFRRAGVTRVRTLQGLLDAGRLSEHVHAGGKRVGVVTMSGGAAAIIADECDRLGLPLSQFSPTTTATLADLVPDYGRCTNPIDLTADAAAAPSDVIRAVEAVLADDGVDIVLCQFTTNADPYASQMATILVETARASAKPLIIGRLGADKLAPAAIEIYRDSFTPLFETPERLVQAAWILSQSGPDNSCDTDSQASSISKPDRTERRCVAVGRHA